MKSDRVERKLAAILPADVVGYSRLMGMDEEGTLRTLSAYREIMDNLVEMHHGRVVGSAGDSLLAEFVSVVEALECAVEIQGILKARTAAIPDDRKLQFRIGINIGDVIVKDNDLFGEGVNIAARLEALADPGGICISGGVYEQLKNKLELAYEFMGKQQVKNISEPVAAFRVGLGEGPVSRKRGAAATKQKAAGAPHMKWVAAAAAVVVLLGAGGGAVWYVNRPPPAGVAAAPAPETAAPAATAPRPASVRLSIAVLPFTNMSGDPEQEAFSDGMTEDIITNLSQLEDVDVISRSSVFTYKGKAVKVQDVGRELGVGYVLEGSVRKSGERVRVTAQLVDTATGHHLWAERYDRDLADVFALQDELTQGIVASLAGYAVKEAEPEAAERNQFEGVGTVLQVRRKKKRVVLEHAEIKGFMTEMVRSYKVRPATLLAGLEVGEKITFVLDIEKRAIVAIKPFGE